VQGLGRGVQLNCSREFDKTSPRQLDGLCGAISLGAEERFADAQDPARPNLDQSGAALDPVERVRRLVRGELRSLAGDVRCVCYRFAGKWHRGVILEDPMIEALLWLVGR
jgi:hypothetical protein